MKINLTLLPLYLLLLFSCSANYTSAQKLRNERFAQENVYYEIQQVVDGDTFWITDGKGRKEKVRFIGIDAPEAKNYGKKVKQPFGEESTTFVKNFLKGKKVRLEFDVQKTDQYRRTLAYIFLEDSTLLNEYIVRNGFAVASTYPPNVKYQARFTKAERFAREKKLGMWK